MNKIFLAAVISLGLAGSAMAHSHSHIQMTKVVKDGKTMYIFAPMTVVTPHGTLVTAPPGMDVDADVEGGNDVSVDIEPTGRRGILGLGFWGL
jgi:hypothetical protein